MLLSSDCRAQAHHRTAAVQDSRIVPMDIVDEPFDWWLLS